MASGSTSQRKLVRPTRLHMVVERKLPTRSQQPVRILASAKAVSELSTVNKVPKKTDPKYFSGENAEEAADNDAMFKDFFERAQDSDDSCVALLIQWNDHGINVPEIHQARTSKTLMHVAVSKHLVETVKRLWNYEGVHQMLLITTRRAPVT